LSYVDDAHNEQPTLEYKQWVFKFLDDTTDKHLFMQNMFINVQSMCFHNKAFKETHLHTYTSIIHPLTSITMSENERIIVIKS
jgi:hypothetical protein